MTRKCDVCGRAEGSTKDCCGEEDGIPLGPVEQCSLCGRRACSECGADNGGEADCCFLEADDHADDPTSAPPGWIVVKAADDVTEWHRIAD
jgi:hypothetical protein